MIVLFKNNLWNIRIVKGLGIILSLFLISSVAKAQISISGQTCVTPGVQYTYNISGSWSSGWTMSWCVSGGTIVGFGSCRSGTPLPSIQVIWNSGITTGSISLSCPGGNPGKSVTASSILSPGAITAGNGQTIMANTIPGGINCSAASGGGCSPSHSYQWQYSTDAVNWQNLNGSDGNVTSQNLSFSGSYTINQATYYRRMVIESSSGSIDYSNYATVFVRQPVTVSGQINCIIPGVTYHYTAGGGWYVSDNFQWCVSGGTIIGGTSCRSGTPLPAIDVVWNSTAANISLTVTGFSPVSNPVTAMSSNQLNIQPSNQDIFSNTTPPLTLGSISSINGCGGYIYQWALNNGTGWQDISGANNETYTIPTALTQITSYQRKIIYNSEVITTSNTAQVTVHNHLSAGNILAPASPINYNTNPGTITESAGASGGICGSYTYEWQSSPDISFSSITVLSGNGPTYSTGNLTATTYYRRKVTCGLETAFSNIVSINVYPQLQAGSVSPASQATINYGTNASQLTLTGVSGGNGTYIYQWQSSFTSSFTSPTNVGNGTTTYTPANLTAQTYFRVAVTSNGVTVYTNSAVVNVYPELQAGSITPSSLTIAYNTAPGQLSRSGVLGGNGTYTYQWQSSPNGSFTNPTNVGTGATTFTPGTLVYTIYYRVVVLSNGVTKYSSTSVITVTAQLTAGTIAGLSVPITYNTSPGIITNSQSPLGGNCANYTYQWEQS
ncbi:MAG TPA: hypothetical protein VJU78_16085, partial [Chitinophagaceae bacterium]|nr:hypothetical protein [Chitinophagaceae bacterium]